MTVKDFIEKLKKLPQNVPVVSNYKEIETVYYTDACYVISDYEEDYVIEDAVVLE